MLGGGGGGGGALIGRYWIWCSNITLLVHGVDKSKIVESGVSIPEACKNFSK